MNSHNVDENQENTIENVPFELQKTVRSFISLQHGKGTVKNFECELKVNDEVKPVYPKLRSHPFKLRQDITQRTGREIIERVEKPQEWMSNIVITPKPNEDIRLCLDAREINRAIIYEKYPTTTLNQLAEQLNGSTIFSKIDLRDAYTKITLSEKSRKLTNFITDDGTFRFRRLIYGISDARDAFQQCLQSKVGNLPGVSCIADDILVYSKDMKQHRVHLKSLFQKLLINGFKINAKKCLIGKRSLPFYGVIFSENGISPDPEKLKALKMPKHHQTNKNYVLLSVCAHTYQNL